MTAASGFWSVMPNGQSYAGGHGYTLATASYQYASACVAPYTAQTDGMFNFTLYGLSGSASATITFKHDLNCRWPQ
ncbi:hypothetical protein LMG26690_05160 [Achromobacter animicus]|uniref:Uncharacterized protein n=1 Tax=Achromobacter animicus TaxID=1389935 RepID=A0A6S7AT83_9BURK|nr:hypothetical protein LMG26690_05160 [Achromobacter animicus]